MIVDSSALVAILRLEPDAGRYNDAIAGTDRPKISAVNYVEAAIVVESARDPVATRRFDQFVTESGLSLVPVTASQALAARAAYRDFGKGSGHPARLNFGDCFAYALAAESGEPLLFKGDDFGHTDVTPALPPAG